jgi:hypothetical protein
MLVLGYAILWTTEDDETMERHARPLLAHSKNVDPQDIGIEEVGGAEDPRPELDPRSIAVEPSVEPEEDKYNLGEYGSVSGNESTSDVASEIRPQTKSFLSAKQRRDLKKSTSSKPESSQASIPQPSSKPKTVPPARGKKSKLKKLKERYADQSDEERQLVQRLLGTKLEIPEPPPEPNTLDMPQPAQREQVKPRSQPKPIVNEPLEVET